MANGCYVKSMAQVSCQKPLSDEWLEAPQMYDSDYVRALEPDTKGMIMPSEARRMSKILKRTVATSITALNDSGLQHPDAIITGTGMGCIENSEKFLIDLSTFGESCLKPTLFMQSTHNTISSLIAIILKCHGYNNTYSHKGISFQSALFDAFLQIRSGEIRNALVGSHDEVTPFLDLVLDHTHREFGMVSETSVAMMLTRSAEDAVCEVADVKILYRPTPEALAHELEADGNPVMTGINGREANDIPYREVFARMAGKPAVLKYRHIFGDNFSSPAAGFYAAARILERGVIPGFMNGSEQPLPQGTPEGITLLDHSEGSAWSIIRLKAVKPCGN